MVRPAFVWNSGNGNGYNVAEFIADFGLGGNCEVSPFTSADAYKGIILCRDDGLDDPSTYETVEFASAQAAQAGAIALMGVDAAFTADLPLCLIIVKNNGSTYVGGAIMQIEPVNLGNSYIYRDVRTWLHTHRGGPG